jgi:hypothetical protein
VDDVVPREQLLERAQQFAEQWLSDGRGRKLAELGLVEEYKAVNDAESRQLAQCVSLVCPRVLSPLSR